MPNLVGRLLLRLDHELHAAGELFGPLRELVDPHRELVDPFGEDAEAGGELVDPSGELADQHRRLQHLVAEQEDPAVAPGDPLRLPADG